MPVLDIERIKQLISDRDAKRQECAKWCLDALGEFPAAARSLGTPTQGNPAVFKEFFGRAARSGMFPILVGDDPDFVARMVRGAVLLGSGDLYTDNRRASLAEGAAWIAARCDFSVDVANVVFTQALMGEPWTIREALRAAARVAE